MNIVEALKSMEYYVILQTADGRRWLYWDNATKQWIVKMGRRGPGGNRVLLETESEEKAVEELLQ